MEAPDPDSQTALEGFAWQGLEMSVEGGGRTQFEAEQLFYNWFGRKRMHGEGITYWEDEQAIDAC